MNYGFFPDHGEASIAREGREGLCGPTLPEGLCHPTLSTGKSRKDGARRGLCDPTLFAYCAGAARNKA